MNCDSLVGRFRDICRGHDDAGNPVLTPEKCTAYRKLWVSKGIIPSGTTNLSTPSLFSKAKSFGSSLLAHIRNALKPTPKPLFDLRLAICQECDRFNAAEMKCGECGCNMNVKLSWAASKCPLGKWGAE